MSATTTPTQALPQDDDWLETSGLNAGDVAQARVHMHSAERIVDTLFALAEGLHIGHGHAAAPAHRTVAHTPGN